MITVFEAFSGVKAQEMALRNIGVKFKSVGVAEVNEPALLASAAIFTQTNNITIPSIEEMQYYMEHLNIPLNDKGKRVFLKGKRLENLYRASVALQNVGDISKVSVENIPDIDLFTYSFPCQSISFAGLGHGLSKDSGTRSSLLWECERIIEAKRPKYLLMENVKALLSKKHKADFLKWCNLLESLGYSNYYQVLNAKDYGIPQNRDRVFMISIRSDLKQDYTFPQKEELKLFVKDILEKDVRENFYLSKDRVDDLILSDKALEKRLLQRIGNSNPSGNGMNGEVFYGGDENIIPTLTTNKGEGLKIALPKIAASRGRYIDNPKSRQSGLPTKQHLELNENDVSNTLTTVQKDNLVVDDTKYIGNDVHPFSKKIEFNHYKNYDNTGTLLATDYKCPKTVAIYQRPRGYNKGNLFDKVSPTLSSHSWHENNLLLSDVISIRKLTPRECWRLMGFSDNDFDKASQVVSNTQLYKQAGNSIVVPVLEGIFKQLLK